MTNTSAMRERPTLPRADELASRIRLGLASSLDRIRGLATPDEIRDRLERSTRGIIGEARELADELGRTNPIARRRQRAMRRQRLGVVAVAGLAAAAGAAMALLLDPERGHSRRAYLGARLAATSRRVARTGVRAGRLAGSRAAGFVGWLRSRAGPRRTADDVTLAHRVETELFRDSKIDKGRLSINAEQGVIYLRGTAETVDRIGDIERRTRRIDGVRAVENLLHLPGTPAPSVHARGGDRASHVDRNGSREPLGVGPGGSA